MHPWKGKTWAERKASVAAFKEWYANNPSERLIAGIEREDGRVFASYSANAKDGERWITKDSRERDLARMAGWFKKNHKEELLRRRERYRNDPATRERVRQNRIKWSAENRDKIAEYNRQWRSENRERYRQHQTAWIERNKEAVKARAREYGKRFPEKRNAATARRWAAKKRQLHPAHDFQREVEMRAIARTLEKQTGQKHHVDHIIPLAHGGWHHHDNLQVLPIALNLAKGTDPFWHHPGHKSWRDVPESLWPDQLRDQYRTLILRSA